MNFQNTGGGFPPGMPGNMQHMQQANPAHIQNSGNQIGRYIAQRIQAQGPFGGWQATVDPNERAMTVKKITDSLRLVNSNAMNSPQHAVNVALQFEQKTFMQSPDKENYIRTCHEKLLTIHDTRARQAQAQNDGNPMHMPGPGPNQLFPPQLQQQMRPSPLPNQQQVNGLGMHMGMGQQQPQQHQGMQQMGGASQMPQGSQNPNAPGGGLAPEEISEIAQIAAQIAQGHSPEDLAKLRANLNSSVPTQTKNHLASRGVDLVHWYFRQQAQKRFLTQKQQRLAATKGQGDPNHPNNMNNMQRQPSAHMTSQQSQGQPMTNMTHFQGQQADGMRSQEAGQLVVPASNAAGIPPDQFRLQQQMLQNQRYGQQAPNANALAQQQQQMQAAQQAQKEKMQANSQAQAQLRAQANARTMNMQGQQAANISQASPAMSMLTQPVGQNMQGPPGSRPPSRTPVPAQQNVQMPMQQQQQQPQIPGGQPGHPGLNPQTMQQFQKFPPQLQNALMKAPQQQWQAIIMRFQAQAQAARAANQQAPQMQQVMSQQGQMQQNSGGQFPGNNNLGGPPMQQSLSTGPPTTQAQAQSPHVQQIMMQQQQQRQQQQQQQQQQQNLLRQRQLQQQQQLQQQHQQQQQQAQPQVQAGNVVGRAPTEAELSQMDNHQFPNAILDTSGLRAMAPPNMKLWGQLKAWARNNPTQQLPMTKLISLQRLHWSKLAQQHQEARGQNGQIPGSMQQGNLQQAHMQQGLPNQMGQQGQVRMPGQPQIAGVPNHLMNQQPSAIDIQRAKDKYPNLQHVPDKQIAGMLKKQQLHKLMQQQQQAQAQGQQSQQISMLQQPGSQISGQPGPQRPQMNMQGMAGPIEGSAPQRQGQSQLPGPRPGMPNQGGQVPVVNQQHPANHQGPKGLKRPSEDVIEVPNPNIANQNQSNNQVGQPPQLTKEQFDAMSDIQKQQYVQLRAMSAKNSHKLARLQQLYEMVKSSMPQLKPVPMKPEVRARMAQMLGPGQIREMLLRSDALIKQYFVATGDEEGTREFMSQRLHLLQQYKEGTLPNKTFVFVDQFTISAEYLELAVKQIKEKYDRVMRLVGKGQQPQPLNPINVRAPQDQPPAQQPATKASRGNQGGAPQAPTTTQPPFPINASSPQQRGQGTPVYASVQHPGLKAEDLKLPPDAKRRKKNQTPTASSPSMTQKPTPSASPQTQRTKIEDLPYKCLSEDCEYHRKGFASQVDLDTHVAERHKPIEEEVADPLAYFVSSVAKGLGVDEDGKPLRTATNEKADAKGDDARKGKPSAAIKVEGAGKTTTPPSRSAPLTKGASQAGNSTSPATSKKGESTASGADASAHEEQDASGWGNAPVSLELLRQAFGGSTASDVQEDTSHDWLDDIYSQMDQFAENEAFTKMQENASKEKTSPSTSSNESPTQNSESTGSNFTDLSIVDPELAAFIKDEEEKFEKENMKPLGNKWTKLSVDAFDWDIIGKKDFKSGAQGGSDDKMDVDQTEEGYVSLWDEYVQPTRNDDEEWQTLDWEKVLQDF